MNPTRGELLTLFQAEPEIGELAPRAHTVGAATKIRASALGAAVHLFRREHGAVALDFLAALQAGTDYSPGDPCLLLREYAVRVAGARTVRPTSAEWFAVVIKAGNYWISGTPLRILKWARVGRNREQFPRVLSRDELPQVEAADS